VAALERRGERRTSLATDDYPSIKTSIGDLWVEPGVICLKIFHRRLTMQLMRDQLEFLRRMEDETAIVPAPIMLDLGELEFIDRGAREYASALMNPRWVGSLAILCHNPVQNVIASFFQGLDKIRVPVAITASKEEAISALESISDGHRPPAASTTGTDRVQSLVETVSRMAAGDFSVEVSSTDSLDELDALSCGLAMLAEETANLIELRKQAEAELLAMNNRLLTEISERKKMAAELERINTELDGFAHTVSHDLKGPLSAIGAASRLIIHIRSLPSTRETESNVEELLWLMVHNVERAHAFIEDTLSLAEAGQIPSVVCSVDIASVVSKVLEERAHDIDSLGIRTTVDDDLGAIVGNPTQIYQVFANIIGNAISHNDNSKPLIEIRRLDGQGPGVRCLVKDNGSGIPPGQLDHIFEPFRSTGQTTGVGLSIASRIVDVYGGKITASNDGGACFEVSLYDFSEPVATAGATAARRRMRA
jgi:signal transduction histidine kinase